MREFNFDKHTSRKAIISDIRYQSERKIDFLETNGFKCEMSSLFLLALNLLVVYPDSFSYPIFIYIIFQLLYGHYEIKKAALIEEDNEALAKMLYDLLLPTLIYYGIDIKYGDYDKYKILLDDLLKSPKDLSMPHMINPNPEALVLIEEAYTLIEDYLSCGYSEDDDKVIEIYGIISGIISEYPYFENLETYLSAINYYKKLLKSQSLSYHR